MKVLQIREKSMLTCPKEKVVVISVCYFFRNQVTYSLLMIGHGGFLVWKSLLFCLLLGGCIEFDLYHLH